MSAVPGWYDDPEGKDRIRWWNGSAWTEHVQPKAGGSTLVHAIPSATPSALSGSAPAHRLAELQAEYDRLRDLVVETRELLQLQNVGLYEYAHPLDSSREGKEALKSLREAMKSAVKEGRAVGGTDRWAINGSQKEGAKMVSDFCKLLLRAYNAEADNLVRSMRPYGRDAAVKRLENLRASISKLASSMKIEISDLYHRMRIRELELTSDYKVKLEEEKEREREERARLREEAAAQKELERARAKLEKERHHYESRDRRSSSGQASR